MWSTSVIVSTALTIAFVVGFVVTAAGLVRAFIAARKDLGKSKAMFTRHAELDAQEIAEGLPGASLQQQEAVIAKYRALHEANGWPRPPGLSEASQGGIEAVYVLGKVLDSARTSLILAGVGLLITTAASIVALYV